MKLKTYVRIWILCTLVLAWESFCLNCWPEMSILRNLQASGVIDKNLALTPDPGKTVSLWLGWGGISTMLLTNLYILRKRFGFLKKAGNLSGWLNFHIFCGLVGPTLILFHTNFKIGGLVAISFWSMVVSFSSGVVGRYFYLQVVSQKSDLEKQLQAYDAQIKQFTGGSAAGSDAQLRVLALAGAGAATAIDVGVLQSIVGSMWGDLRLRFGLARIAGNLPIQQQYTLVRFAVTRRRILYLDQFRRVMGYWHAFHMPFAVFMYVVAAIHIATALLMGV